MIKKDDSKGQSSSSASKSHRLKVSSSGGEVKRHHSLDSRVGSHTAVNDAAGGVGGGGSAAPGAVSAAKQAVGLVQEWIKSGGTPTVCAELAKIIVEKTR